MLSHAQPADRASHIAAIDRYITGTPCRTDFLRQGLSYHHRGSQLTLFGDELVLDQADNDLNDQTTDATANKLARERADIHATGRCISSRPEQ